ncbi:MAG: DNA primase [Bauldia sp.]
MRFTPALLDEIRARLPLSAVIGARVQWDKRKSRPARGDFWACCPFHGEKTASFHVDDSKGRYHCFGCGVTGDHFKFVTEKEGASFPEAVEQLAALAGVALPARDARSEERQKAEADLYAVMALAADFFAERLASRDGAAARAYLAGRRLGDGVQRRFKLGYAPNAKNALREHLAGKGVSVERMIEAGLLVSGDDIPVAFDRFRDRVIFPIADSRGRIVAFGGRALSAEVNAKYLNSPETPIFHKGATVYNAAEAKKAVRDGGRLVVVEGYVDVIAMAVAGFPATVAPLGTALTDRQLEMIWQMSGEPVLCFDGDKAGQRAAARAIDLALPMISPERTLRFAVLPEGQDPDDLIGAGGPEAMAEVLAASRPLVEVLWSREVDAAQTDTPEGLAALEKRLMTLAGTIGEPSVRVRYQQAFRERLEAAFGGHAAPAPFGGRRWGGERRQSRSPRDRRLPPPIRVSETLSNRARLRAAEALPFREVLLVVTVVNHPAILMRHFDIFAGFDFKSRTLDLLRGQILEIAGNEPGIDAERLRALLVEGGRETLLARLDAEVTRYRTWQAAPEAADGDAEWGWLQAARLQKNSRSLSKELGEASSALGSDSSEANFARIVDIKSQLTAEEGTEALIEGFGASSGRPSRVL